jgi:hypothetical protein
MAAIYMWFEPGEQVVLTTTLYPVDVDDSLAIEISMLGGTMNLLPHSEFSSDFEAQDGTYEQLRWFFFDGPYDSYFSSDFEVQDGTYEQLRWFFFDGPYDSYFSSDFEAQDGLLRNLLIWGDTPDEELQMAIVISATSTMDLI